MLSISEQLAAITLCLVFFPLKTLLYNLLIGLGGLVVGSFFSVFVLPYFIIRSFYEELFYRGESFSPFLYYSILALCVLATPLYIGLGFLALFAAGMGLLAATVMDIAGSIYYSFLCGLNGFPGFVQGLVYEHSYFSTPLTFINGRANLASSSSIVHAQDNPITLNHLNNNEQTAKETLLLTEGEIESLKKIAKSKAEDKHVKIITNLLPRYLHLQEITMALDTLNALKELKKEKTTLEENSNYATVENKALENLIPLIQEKEKEYEKLEVTDSFIGLEITFECVPILVVKQYANQNIWQAVPKSTNITTLETFSTWCCSSQNQNNSISNEKVFNTKVVHPLSKELLLQPKEEKINGKNYPTRYVWHEYNGYSQELHQLAGQIRSAHEKFKKNEKSALTNEIFKLPNPVELGSHPNFFLSPKTAINIADTEQNAVGNSLNAVN